MITNLLYFLPFVVCLIWAFTFMFRRKNTIQQLLNCMIWIALFNFFTLALYLSPSSDARTTTICDIINQPLLLILAAVTYIYINTHRTKKLMDDAQKIICVLPTVIHSSLLWVLCYILGIDNVVSFREMVEDEVLYHHGVSYLIDLPAEFDTSLYRAYYYVDYFLIAILLVAAFFAILRECFLIEKNEGYRFGDIFKAWFRGKPTTPSRVIAYWLFHTLLFLSPTLVLDYPLFKLYPILGMTVSVLTAMSMYCLLYCEYYSFLPNYSVWNLFRTNLDCHCWEQMEKSDGALADGKCQEGHTDSIVQTEDVDTGKETAEMQSVQISSVITPNVMSLAERMKSALTDKDVYTDTNISIEMLARQLGTNRTTLSSLVNQTYGMNFKSLIATLRIEEAKRRILQDPTLTFEAISIECGFKDKANFFHRFKELTGETPRVWLLKQIRQGGGYS